MKTVPDLPQPTHRHPPPIVAWLGYGGLMPFIGLAVLTGADAQRAGQWSAALLGYGAVILAFVGALHWGVAMSVPGLDPRLRRQAFVWSVVPALLAWLATVLGGPTAPWILLGGFALHLAHDHRLAGPAGLPAWYLPLRWRLTGVAVACLLFGAWAGAGHG